MEIVFQMNSEVAYRLKRVKIFRNEKNTQIILTSGNCK